MDVLVLGGTGFIGTALASELRDRGHDVTVLSRDPDPAEIPTDVQAVSGDVTDRESIEPAFEGVDAAVNLVALSPLYKTRGDRTHDRIHLGGTENVVAAAEAQDVGRVVQLSGLDADPDGPTAFLRAKGRAEGVVADADVPAVVFRPSVVFGEGAEFVSFTKRTKHLFAPYLPVAPLPGGGATRFQPIHRDDVVGMIADGVEDDEHLGQTYEIGGPEVLTLAEVTRMAYEAEGKRMRVAPIPMPLAKLGLTVMGAIPPFPFGPDQYRSLQMDNTVADNDVEAFGIEESDLTTLGEYLGIEA